MKKEKAIMKNVPMKGIITPILTYKEDRKLGFSVVFALVCAVGIYAMFKYGFKMPLPQGILKGIF